MLKSIFSTTGVRLGTSVIGLLLVMLNARMVGAEGLGEIRIFTITVTLLIIVANLLGGPNLIYRTSRHKVIALIQWSYLWSTGIVFLFFILQFIPGLQFEHHGYIALCTAFYAMAWVNLYVLLGLEDIRGHNVVLFSFSGFLLIGTLAGYFVFQWETPMNYISMYVASSFVKFISGWLFLIPHYRKGDLQREKGESVNLAKVLLTDGSMVQSGNLFQQINYRIGDYILEATWGKAAVGIYSAAIQLGEGVWTIGRSAALVQYSRLSNLGNPERGKKLTYLLSKAVFVITALAFIVLCILPVSFYTLLFGEDFTELRSIIRWISPILTLYSMAFLFSHYFSSQGQFLRNTMTSFLSLFATIAAATILIPKFGIYGAIGTQTFSYLCGFCILVYFMHREHHRINHWILPGKKDWRLIRLIIYRRKKLK
ncbi:MAG: oligosaccharide flippase family protein [Cryomorphaceae bacterium]|nr:oligosaccharide flippase family protein [Cryomorphaceae bacterium]